MIQKEKHTTSVPFRIKKSLMRIQRSTSNPKGWGYENLELRQDKSVKTNLLPLNQSTQAKLTFFSTFPAENLKGISDNI